MWLIPSLWRSFNVPLPLSQLVLMVNPWYSVICCLTTAVGDIIVPSISEENIVLTMIMSPSSVCHGSRPSPVQTIAMSSAFTPPIGYGAISLYLYSNCLLLVTALLAPVSFCILSVNILILAHN